MAKEGTGTTRRRLLRTSLVKKRSPDLKQRRAASGASLAASGAASWVRHKVRVRGLFGTRFWVYPGDKPVLGTELDALNAKFQKKNAKPNFQKEYKSQLRALLVNNFALGQRRDARNPPPPTIVAISEESTKLTEAPTRETRQPAVAMKTPAATSPRRQTTKRERQPAAAQKTTPASGGGKCSGLDSSTLQTRLLRAFKPLDVVEIGQPSGSSVVASYVREQDAAIAYMQPAGATDDDSATGVQWLPQEAADWLYQATHYVIPLLQTLLGTNSAFDANGEYRDASGTPASGGQLAAFWGTEIGSRRDRALIAYDADVDFEAFLTPCCDFDTIWSAATAFLESRDLMCKTTIKGKYYRISPRRPLTSNHWKELCRISIWRPALN